MVVASSLALTLGADVAPDREGQFPL